MNPTIIKKEDARLKESSSLNDPTASCEAAGVKVHETGGRVQAIEVTCACGETTVIKLEYPSRETTS